MEIQRLLLREEPIKNATAISNLEDAMNERALELAANVLAEERPIVDTESSGIPLAEPPLDKNEEFLAKEGAVGQIIREMPLNTAGETLLKDKLLQIESFSNNKDVKNLRAEYLDPEPEGRLIEHLLLDDDPEYLELEKRLFEAMRSSEGDPNVINALKAKLNERAHQVAKALNASERKDYLDPTPRGVPIDDLPLDTDEKFSKLEADRARLRQSPRRNHEEILSMEEALNSRTRELAYEAICRDRSYLDDHPEGVPLELLPLNTDQLFQLLEKERASILFTHPVSASKLSEKEKALNNRAHELAAEYKKCARAQYIREEEIPFSAENLSLEYDIPFQELEARRFQLLTRKEEHGDHLLTEIEEALTNRAKEIANIRQEEQRNFLDQHPLGVKLTSIPLNKNAEFLQKEEELRKIREYPQKQEEIASLEKELKTMVKEMAAKEIEETYPYIEANPEGIPIHHLQLSHDPQFLAMEQERRQLLEKDPRRNAKEIAALEESMNARAQELAREKKLADRAFLDQKPEGVPLRELPLDDDSDFVAMEQERRQLLEKDPRRNAKEIAALEESMNVCARNLAVEIHLRERHFLDDVVKGVPLDALLLNEDNELTLLEARRREILRTSSAENSQEIVELEKRIVDRVEFLAENFDDHLLDFLDSMPEGISLSELELDGDREFCNMKKVLVELMRAPRDNAEAIKDQQYAMNNRVHELAQESLRSDREYLHPEPQGVPQGDLPLDDPVFHEMELQRRKLKKDPERNAIKISELEKRLNDRADEIAKLLRAKERAFLEMEPEGIPIERLPLNEDPILHELETNYRKLLKVTPRDKKAIRGIEEQIRSRVHELALQQRGWQDEEFHESNKHMAEEWPRICELYPEGIRDPVVPEKTLPSQVSSAPLELGYLAPFIAAMSRHPPLIYRLFDSKEHPVNGPYSFIFYDPNSNPVRVEIDDRVPVDANMEPKFTRVPKRSWYPLLLEKAYAKFVGGYSRLDQCTPHETLRDLTGRPVTHIPFEDKRAEGIKMGDFRSAQFWREIHSDLSKGDLITCMSNKHVPDGIHPLCSYALFAVIETVKDSKDPADIVIKLHNCYFDEPFYSGPLNRNDGGWTTELMSACRYNPSEEEFLYLPQPVFLNNFSSMQRCHINCGDRLTAIGEWDKTSCGGNPKFTTFRNNPIYLVENKSSRPVRILAELRHQAPVFYDADSVGHYHQTGLALLQHDGSVSVLSGIITNSSHNFIQKGIMLDTRELCSRMDIPSNSTCILIPYTMKRGCLGKFSVSIYPGDSSVNFMPLTPLSVTHNVCDVDVILTPGSREGKRIEFVVNGACDAHLLLRQNKITDPASIKKGDVLAEDDVMMMLYDEYMTRLASTGDATSAREHSLALELPSAGRYSVFLACPNKPVTGNCPCSLYIYTPKQVATRILPRPTNGTQQMLPFLSLPQSSKGATRGNVKGRAIGAGDVAIGTGNRPVESQGMKLPNPPRNGRPTYHR
ncbi:calpain-like cysteine peptidase [Trypanosoma cruzi marinkellei]|uniref:Calpain-like cysteine peptidase n=1 Tax=Trypanosoma cruzi marinkellei TaxID=85056 RepID=K2MS01_TRYCR|nr:calpain-like cysteine peptidase [Trypanosoma cruzi marinkellei]